jgi:7-cyano-7-deazaguanine synthase
MKLESSAVVVVSGGMDSITLCAYCLENGTEIYPIFINRGQRSLEKENQSVDYFNSYFKKRYPGKYRSIYKIEVPVPPKQIRKDFKDIGMAKYALRNLILVSSAVIYANCLRAKGTDIEAIYVGSNMGDVETTDSSPEFWKQVEITAHYGLKEFDYSPRIYAPLQSLGWDKKEIVLWAYENGIPLHKSWSCYENNDKHCGECNSCVRRREAYKLAGIEDLTGYLK